MLYKKQKIVLTLTKFCYMIRFFYMIRVFFSKDLLLFFYKKTFFRKQNTKNIFFKFFYQNEFEFFSSESGFLRYLVLQTKKNFSTVECSIRNNILKVPSAVCLKCHISYVKEENFSVTLSSLSYEFI